MKNQKKIAIIHDSLTEFGGAEQVLNQLLDIFPEADLYTSLATSDTLTKIKLGKNRLVKYSRLSNCKQITKNPSFFKPYFYHFYWPSLKLDQYDLVISSSHSFCANWVNVKNTHISYIHTPPRFLYQGINAQSWLKEKPWKWIFAPYFTILKKIDYRKIEKIDLLLTNSKNVKTRINDCYKRSAKIIYPPINLLDQTTDLVKDRQKKYYLYFSRLVEQKGIKLAIETFRKLQKPLIVVGTSPKIEKFKKKSPKNVKFLGFVEEKKLKKIIQKARALIYPAIDEDFGIAPIEVLSLGVPVVAHYSGGPKETLNDSCAVFFKEYSSANLIKAIKKIDGREIKAEDCKKQAKKFIKHDFKKEFLDSIKSYVN